MKGNRMRNRRAIMPTATLTLGLLMVGLLAGCGSTGATSPAASPTQSVSRQAALTLPVNVCYTNHAIFDTQETITLEIGNKDVPYGETACFVSDSRFTETKFYMNDDRDTFYATFQASNPYLEYPWLSIKFFGEMESVNHSFSALETVVFEDRVWAWTYTVQRKEDTNEMKQFTVDIQVW